MEPTKTIVSPSKAHESDRLAYRHSRIFQKPCAKCASTEHKHAGYCGRGRVRIWRCRKCWATCQLAATHIEVVDETGVGRLVQIVTPI